MRDIIDDAERSVPSHSAPPASIDSFPSDAHPFFDSKMANVTGRNPFLFASKIAPPVEFLDSSPGYSDEASDDDDDSLLDARPEEEEPEEAVLHVKMLPVHKVGVPIASQPPTSAKMEVPRGRQGKSKEAPPAAPLQVPHVQSGPPVNPLTSLDRNLVSVLQYYKGNVISNISCQVLDLSSDIHGALSQGFVICDTGDLVQTWADTNTHL
jgi:hypothetical protein